MNPKVIEQGEQAFKEGNIGNPYKKDTQKWRDWQLGFDKEYFFNLKRIRAEEGSRGVSRRQEEKEKAQ